MTRLASLLFLCAALACRKDPAIRAEDGGPPKPVDGGPDAPRSPLVGLWRAEGSRRGVEAVAKDGGFEFRVTDPLEWKGAYALGEVRFVLLPDQDGYAVLDRYRPFEIAGRLYVDDAARAACLTEHTVDHEGQPLHATRLDDETLAVTFAEVRQDVQSTLTGEVSGCGPALRVGRLRVVLHRVRPDAGPNGP